MKGKIFYDHLVRLEEVLVEFKQGELTLEERETVLDIADETVHTRVLKVILDRLPLHRHRLFLNRFHKEPYRAELMDFLKRETGVNIEKLIEIEAEKVKRRLRILIAGSRKYRDKQTR